MKIEQLYESILEEGISPIVYHSTNIRNFIDTLRSDTFKLSPAFTTQAELEINKNKFFFLSTTRTRTGKYHQGKNGNAFIKLDGRKLANRFAGAAVDYWGHQYRQFANGEYEQEDRIISDNDVINNATSYILAVDFVLSYKPDKRSIRQLANVIIAVKKLNIPTRVFKNSRDLVAQQNELAIDELLQTFDDSTGNSKEVASYYRRRPSNERYHDFVIAMFHALKFEPNARMSDPDRKAVIELIRNMMRREDGGINADLHNARSNPRYNNLISDLTKLLRKNGYSRWQEAREMLIDKWKPIL
ncbi:hypothetical protein [Alishewanella phage vB_AspM_Slicko01]|nr:hypothetical protein [Alishewanella phage vB_AspM_Slicko01]